MNGGGREIEQISVEVSPGAMRCAETEKVEFSGANSMEYHGVQDLVGRSGVVPMPQTPKNLEVYSSMGPRSIRGLFAISTASGW